MGLIKILGWEKKTITCTSTRNGFFKKIATSNTEIVETLSEILAD